MISKAEIKYLNSLKYKKHREKHGVFLVEGHRIISSALEFDNSIETIFLTERFKKPLSSRSVLEKIQTSQIPKKIIDEKEMNIITETETPSGIAALCTMQNLKTNLTEFAGPGIFLDKISDPGNFGTICRTASWFGVNHVFLSQHCVDPFNPKAVRSGAGAHFHLRFYQVDLKTLSEKKFDIIGTDITGTPVQEFKRKNINNLVVVFGNEARGISDKNRPYLDKIVSIPKHGFGESLNVAAAAGIILSYLIN
tara:strand:- start:91300 stop:92055 length:756 start_codon:yes stop_codon:yes gene_type:complete